MIAKDRHKCKLLEYLGNPENEFPTRLFMNCEVIGFKDPTRLYKVFTLDELDEIEAEALAIRRKKYKPGLATADKALLSEAKDGNVAAIKLCYQRFEDWSEKQRKEHTGKDGEALFNTPLLKAFIAEVTDSKGVEYVETLKKRLIEDAASDSE